MASVHPWQKDSSPSASREHFLFYIQERKGKSPLSLEILQSPVNSNDKLVSGSGGVYEQLEESERGIRE